MNLSKSRAYEHLLLLSSSNSDNVHAESRAPNRLCALIRVSSDSQLHDQAVQASARSHLERIIKPDTIGALDEVYLDHAEDILDIVSQHNIRSVSVTFIYFSRFEALMS